MTKATKAAKASSVKKVLQTPSTIKKNTLFHAWAKGEAREKKLGGWPTQQYPSRTTTTLLRDNKQPSSNAFPGVGGEGLCAAHASSSKSSMDEDSHSRDPPMCLNMALGSHDALGNDMIKDTNGNDDERKPSPPVEPPVFIEVKTRSGTSPRNVADDRSCSNDSSTTLGLAEIPDLTSAGSVVSALSSIGSNSAGHLLPQDMIIPSDTYIMNVIQTCSGLSPTAKSIGVADLRLILNSLSLHQSTHHEVEEEVIGMVADVGAQADMTITADAVEEAADMEEGVVDMEVFGSIGHPKEEGVDKPIIRRATPADLMQKNGFLISKFYSDTPCKDEGCLSVDCSLGHQCNCKLHKHLGPVLSGLCFPAFKNGNRAKGCIKSQADSTREKDKGCMMCSRPNTKPNNFYNCSNPSHRHCCNACMELTGCERTEEQEELLRQRQAIVSAKKSLELLEKKLAETNKLISAGHCIALYITPIQLESIALRLVDHIKTILAEDEALYAFGARKYRAGVEAWTRSTTGLITKENGANINETELKDRGWKSELNLYESTNPDNVNAVEKKIHQLMYEDPRSIWLECGMGGVNHVYENGTYLMQTFTFGIIHGPKKGLSFTAKHPRKLITISD